MSERRNRMEGSGLNKQTLDCIAMIRDSYSSLIQDTNIGEIASKQLTIATDCSAVAKPTIIFFKLPKVRKNRDETFKSLFYAASQELIPTTLDALIIYVNIMRLVFINFDNEIRAALLQSGMDVVDGSDDEMLDWLELITDGKISQEEYQNIKFESHHYRVLIGISFNLITKKLTPQNNDQWLKRRRAAYARACLGNENDETLIMMTPSLSFSTSVNSAIASCFKLKTLIFQAVRATSQQPSIKTLVHRI